MDTQALIVQSQGLLGDRYLRGPLMLFLKYDFIIIFLVLA